MVAVLDGRSDGSRDKAVGFGNRSTGGGNFGGDVGRPTIYQWGVCGAARPVPNYFWQSCSNVFFPFSCFMVHCDRLVWPSRTLNITYCNSTASTASRAYCALA